MKRKILFLLLIPAVGTLAAIDPKTTSCPGLILHKNNPGQFIATGALAADQNISNYFLTSTGYTCNVHFITCSYYLDSFGVIRQCEEGEYIEPSEE